MPWGRVSRLRVNAAFICGLQVGVPFRLDLGEAYFNKSRSLEMLVPLSGEQHCDTGAAPCMDPNRYRSSRCKHYGTKVDLSAKPFWHLAKRPILANQEPSRPLARNVPMTELMTSHLQYKRRCASELGALNHQSSRPKDREDG